MKGAKQALVAGVVTGTLGVTALFLLGPRGRAEQRSGELAGLGPGTAVVPEETRLPEGVLLLQLASGVTLLAPDATKDLSSAEVVAQDLSPDGASVLATATGVDDAGRYRADELLLIDTENGRRSIIAEASQERSFAEAGWSPDGSKVAYTVGGADPDGGSTLCLLHTPSQKTRCFPEAGPVYSHDWSPDGSGVIAAGAGTQPVRNVHLATERISAVTRQQGATAINRGLALAGLGEGLQLVGPTWSPSGKYLAALANLRGSRFNYVPVVFTAEGGLVAFGRPSREFPRPFGWSPTRDVLAYTRGDPPTGSPRPIFWIRKRVRTCQYLLGPAEGIRSSPD